MPQSEAEKELVDDIEPLYDIPPVTPYPHLLPLDVVPSFESSDSSLDEDANIRSNIFKMLGIDLVDLMYNYIKSGALPEIELSSSDSFLRKSEYISSGHFVQQKRRSEMIKRMKMGISGCTSGNFKGYYEESFNDVDDLPSGIEEYWEIKQGSDVVKLYRADCATDALELNEDNSKETDMSDYLILELTNGGATIRHVSSYLSRKK